jgi:hypothetical protein
VLATTIVFQELPGAWCGQIVGAYSGKFDLHGLQRCEQAAIEVVVYPGDQADFRTVRRGQGHAPCGLRAATAQHAHLGAAIGEDDIIKNDPQRDKEDGHG